MKELYIVETDDEITGTQIDSVHKFRDTAVGRKAILKRGEFKPNVYIYKRPYYES